MQRDERDLLDVLKFELNFLEKGGYGRSPREPWRPQFIFEDSPTCMNYDSKENPAPCEQCVLMHWVPAESREEKIPCRHIPFNAAGETLDSLYRHGDQQEIEDAVRTWLKAEIARFEESRKVGEATKQQDEPRPRDATTASKGLPLGHEMGPKCANPACPTAFHWYEGGKFFRFRPDPATGSSFKCESGSTSVKHFWLCERCRHMFTLVYSGGHGVVVQPLHLELPLDEKDKKSDSAAVAWRAAR